MSRKTEEFGKVNFINPSQKTCDVMLMFSKSKVFPQTFKLVKWPRVIF